MSMHESVEYHFRNYLNECVYSIVSVIAGFLYRHFRKLVVSAVARQFSGV